ncbi:hypothetical protein Hamer_G014837 [Homarus americanus]|uniref:Uncharacterized protein n=1 Tax=Homarus americanus TaxID=6706 RepID=A0A8J5MNH6_HOMAM|nr:hypothetical protein Hamer_G014837 [Homarus americanus]
MACTILISSCKAVIMIISLGRILDDRDQFRMLFSGGFVKIIDGGSRLHKAGAGLLVCGLFVAHENHLLMTRPLTALLGLVDVAQTPPASRCVAVHHSAKHTHHNRQTDQDRQVRRLLLVDLEENIRERQSDNITEHRDLLPTGGKVLGAQVERPRNTPRRPIPAVNRDHQVRQDGDITLQLRVSAADLPPHEHRQGQHQAVGRNPTFSWGRILPYLGRNPTLCWDGFLPYSREESYPILEQNPTIFRGGILPYSVAESYRLLGRIPSVFWGRFLPFSRVESYRILAQNPSVFWSEILLYCGRNPTIFWGRVVPSLGTESYHLLAQNPTVFWSDILPSPWAEP